MQRRIAVYALEGDLLLKKWDAAPDEAQRMIQRSQAQWHIPKVSLVLSKVGEWWPCRTHTSRSPLLGAIGRSQDYTLRNERNRVDGFKCIYPEDRPIFQKSVIDNLRVCCMPFLGIWCRQLVEFAQYVLLA